ncbi:MAG: metallophosphoesterase [Polyangiales bacterium]
MRRALALSLALSAPSVFAQVPLRKGPWVMDPQAGSVVVLAERASPGGLRVTATPVDADAGPAVTAESARGTLHELRLTGLRDGARYRYTVEGDGVAPAQGSFSTLPRTPVPFRFVIYGDTRSSETHHRAAVAAARREGPDFVVHTGDLVEDGRELALWQEFFAIEAPLLRETIFVPVIGNHEIVRPGSPGIENYRRYVHVSADGPSPELDYTFRYGNTRFVLANAYDDWDGEARAWLDRELSRARAEGPDDWLFVVMHWGPRSSGPHGDNPFLAESGVNALLRRHRVDLVIAGHDHLYERGDHDRVRYMVSGGGGAPLYRRRSARDGVIAYASAHHIVRVDVERAKVTFTAVGPDGVPIDRGVLTHDGWEDGPRPTPPAITPHEGPSIPPPAEDPYYIPKVLAAVLAVGGLAWWARRSRG